MTEPPPQLPRHNRRQYLLGLGLGAIPLVVWLIFIGSAAADIAQCSRQGYCDNFGYGGGLAPLSNGLVVFAILWLAEMVVAIVVGRSRRFLGYGLLTMLLIGAVVGTIACNVIPGAARAGAGHETGTPIGSAGPHEEFGMKMTPISAVSGM
jgi:hypothetical protein